MRETLQNLYESEGFRIRLLSGGMHKESLTKPVFGEGPAGCVLMLLGEAPGGEEAKHAGLSWKSRETAG